MGRIIRIITDPIKKIFKKVTGFLGDFFGFNIKPMGASDVGSVEQEQGVLLNKTGTTEQIPVIYGFRRVGGTVIFVETASTNNAYLYVCYVLCEGEIAGVKQIIIDDTKIAGSSFGMYPTNTIIDVTEGKYSGRCQFQVFTGTENQSQSSLLNQTPTWPTKQRTLPGVAYVAMRFEWKPITTQAESDANPYGGGVPQVQFDVHGKKVYDVSTHSTGAQLSNTYANLTKTYVSNQDGPNPANCLLDYLMNPRYGCGISRDEIDADSFKIAANKFNTTVIYASEPGAAPIVRVINGPAMTCCAVLDTRQKLIDNVKILVGGARGMLPYVQGRYKLVVEDGGNATDITSSTVSIAYDVDKSEIVGGITLSGETKGTKYNQVIVNYVDPNTDFTVQQAVHRVSGDLTVDQDEELTGEFTFGTISSTYIAKFMAESIYKKSRNQKSIEFTATQELLDVIPGDIIRVTDDILNLSNKTFRVINMKLNVDGTIGMSCTEHVASNYPYVFGPQKDIPPTVYLPDNPLGPRPITDPPIYVPPPPIQPPPPPPVVPIAVTLYDIPWNTISNVGAQLDYNTNTVALRYKQQFAPTIVDRFMFFVPTEKYGSIPGNVINYMYLNGPADTTIYTINFEVYNGKNKLTGWGYTGTDPDIGRFSTQMVYSGNRNLNPGNERYVFAYRIPLYKNYSYRIRFLKFVGARIYETKVGGDYSWSSWPGSHTYSINGQSITGTDFEAYWNYLASRYGATTGGAANLGA
jgi:hypothetical protein